MNVSDVPLEAAPPTDNKKRAGRKGEAIYYASVAAFYLFALVWLPLLLSAAGCAH